MASQNSAASGSSSTAPTAAPAPAHPSVRNDIRIINDSQLPNARWLADLCALSYNDLVAFARRIGVIQSRGVLIRRDLIVGRINRSYDANVRAEALIAGVDYNGPVLEVENRLREAERLFFNRDSAIRGYLRTHGLSENGTDCDRLLRLFTHLFNAWNSRYGWNIAFVPANTVRQGDNILPSIEDQIIAPSYSPITPADEDVEDSEDRLVPVQTVRGNTPFPSLGRLDSNNQQAKDNENLLQQPITPAPESNASSLPHQSQTPCPDQRCHSCPLNCMAPCCQCRQHWPLVGAPVACRECPRHCLGMAFEPPANPNWARTSASPETYWAGIRTQDFTLPGPRQDSPDSTASLGYVSGTHDRRLPRGGDTGQFLSGADGEDELPEDDEDEPENEEEFEEGEILDDRPNQSLFRYSRLMKSRRRRSPVAEEGEWSSRSSSKRPRSSYDGDDEEDGSDASGRRVRLRYSDEDEAESCASRRRACKRRFGDSQGGSCASERRIRPGYPESPQESLVGDENHPIHVLAIQSSEASSPEFMPTSDTQHGLRPPPPEAFRALQRTPDPEEEMSCYEYFTEDEDETRLRRRSHDLEDMGQLLTILPRIGLNEEDLDKALTEKRREIAELRQHLEEMNAAPSGGN